jgi:hypothetical protein
MKGFDMTIRGGCRCGAVSYVLAIDALPQTYACHCQQCQTWSGSAFAQHALLPETMIEVTGPIVVYEHEGTGGYLSQQKVCGVCHTRIYNTNMAMPGMAVVRAGTLEDSPLLEPIAHIWVKRKQPWLVIPDGVPSFPESPTPEEFMAATRR